MLKVAVSNFMKFVMLGTLNGLTKPQNDSVLELLELK